MGNTGAQGSAATTVDDVIDNREQNRFELTIGGQTAYLAYERTDDSLTFIHTDVPPTLRGHHLGDVLIRAGLNTAHSAGLAIVAVCPFVRAYLRRHKQ